MCGNVTGITKSGKETRAQKIPLKSIGRKVIANIDNEKFFKENTPKEIHGMYD